jgi:UDP-GlcNAc:undecaprenyl-phosphate GlcNAc-1-phosphate transferase
MELFCLILFLVAGATALLTTPPVKRLAEKFCFLDRPDERKNHGRPVAYGGGIVVVVAVAAALICGVLFSSDFNLPKESVALRECLWTAGGALLMFLVGLWDDKRPLSPGVKLAWQFAAASIVVAGGVHLTALVGDTWLMRVVSVFWIVLIANSFNFLDNADGLCAGVAAICAGTLCLITLETRQWIVAAFAAGLCGALAGFLRFNLAPARIFLGDAGSLFVGFLLACLSISAVYYRYQGSVLGLGVPLLVFGLPLYDTASVLWLRVRQRRPAWVGDRSHFSHRLMDLGLSPREAVAILHLAALAVALPATTLSGVSESHGLLIIGQSFLILALVALLENAGRQARRSSSSGSFTDRGGSARNEEEKHDGRSSG